MDEHGNCPVCGVSWDGGSILETFKQKRDEGNDYYKDKSDEQLEAIVKESYSPPYRWRREIGIEYCFTSQDYDGVSEWKCPDCGSRFGRWTKKIIPDGYIESRFGKEGHVKTD